MTETSRLTPATNILQALQTPNPPSSPSAIRSFRFCVPDEWYRRSRSRNLSSASSSSGLTEDTVKQLEALQESPDEEEEEEEEGTAKSPHASRNQGNPPSSQSQNQQTWKGSVTQARLSTLFDGWLGSTSAPTPSTPPTISRRQGIGSSPNRMSVSGPRLVAQHTGGTPRMDSAAAPEGAGDEEGDDVFDESAFDEMVVRLSSSPT